MLCIGIWLYPYTVMSVQVGEIFSENWPSDAIMSYGHMDTPLHCYACGLVLIIAEALFYATVTFSFFCVHKYYSLSTKLSIILAKCTLVLKWVFLSLKMKPKSDCTPPFLLPVTHPCAWCCVTHAWTLWGSIIALVNGGALVIAVEQYKVLAWVRCSTQ